jgi:hypothetical protein
MNRFFKSLAVAAASLSGLALPAQALIVKVTDPQGSADYTALKVVMEEVKARLGEKTSVPSTLKGFEIRVVQGDQVTSDLSLAPGSTSLFWSDGGLVYQQGFSAQGGRALFSSEKSTAAGGPKPAVRAAASQDRLSMAMLSNSRLSLRYSVAAPGPVKAELFSAKGSLVKRWTWTEAMAGPQSKVLEVPRLNNGLHFLRWSNGAYRVVQPLAPGEGRTAR